LIFDFNLFIGSFHLTINKSAQRKREHDVTDCKLFMKGLVFVLGVPTIFSISIVYDYFLFLFNILFMFIIFIMIGSYTGLLKSSIESKLRASGAAVHERVTSLTTHFLSQYLPEVSVAPGMPRWGGGKWRREGVE
jgi:hypothetical protein